MLLDAAEESVVRPLVRPIARTIDIRRLLNRLAGWGPAKDPTGVSELVLRAPPELGKRRPCRLSARRDSRARKTQDENVVGV